VRQLENGTGVTRHELVLPSTKSEYESKEGLFLECYTEGHHTLLPFENVV
jgi:hypothetical protein